MKLPDSKSVSEWREGIARLMNRLAPKIRKAERPERRTQARQETLFQAVITSPTGSMPVQGLNLHETGLCVLSSIPLAPESVIFVHIKRIGLLGFAHVRHCTPRGRAAFALGLEFLSAPMREELGNWYFERISESDVRPAARAS